MAPNSYIPEDLHKVILATASYDLDIKLWEAHTGVCEKTIQYPDGVRKVQINALEISPDHSLLVAVGHQNIRIYDISNSSNNPLMLVNTVNKNYKNVTCVGFKENGQMLYVGGEDGIAKIYDLSNIKHGNLNLIRRMTVENIINCMILHPNQAVLYIGDQNGYIYIWNLSKGETDTLSDSLNPEVGSSIQDLAVDRKGHFLAAINNKGTVFIWTMKKDGDSAADLIPTHSMSAHERYGLKVRFNQDCNLMLTTSADCSTRVWKVKDFSLLAKLEDPSQRWVWGAEFTNDSKFVISASSDGTARLWSLSDNQIVREYSGHRNAITAIAFKDRPKT